MPVPSYELGRLGPDAFEHLVNMLALKVLGAGATGFGPGKDGGRDGYFEGRASYPSEQGGWSGVWYIQSKFHAPHLSTDPQKWLISRLESEIDEFQRPESRRRLPDNWILATNIDPSGAPETGAFDRAAKIIEDRLPHLKGHFHIWGGKKIIDLLSTHPLITDNYFDLVSPGRVLSKIYNAFDEDKSIINLTIRLCIATKLNEHQYTKLEQAGSVTDTRPGIHDLFKDLPFRSRNNEQMALGALTKALSQNHRYEMPETSSVAWAKWSRDPVRARVWFVKGGPGQGKSTLTQYVCQIQRAALLLSPNAPPHTPAQSALAQRIRCAAEKDGFWPTIPRVPIAVELKEFAHWFGQQSETDSRRVLSYLAQVFSKELGEEIKANTLRKGFGEGRWLFVFDGLDEVPADIKDSVAAEIVYFLDDFLVGCKSDAAAVCTSRPQGYAGQFGDLVAATIELSKLSPAQALACAGPVLAIERTEGEQRTYLDTLTEALASPAVAEIMTTPLQSHIMAVIVRDGGRPPQRKWQLFNTFYSTMKKREANKNPTDRKLSKLLREGDKLLKSLHNRLGFELHARAETSNGATTSISRELLNVIVTKVVSDLQDDNVEETVAVLMEATTDRLVLVSTPESGDEVSFDIRPLQEFFAAEYIYEGNSIDIFLNRFRCIAGDSHWREVVHFALSGLIEGERQIELTNAVAIVSQLDEHDAAGVRTLLRRLARGGISAARLLEEGVLEQDKKIRVLFRGCLPPLLACPEGYRYLVGTHVPHSRNWLIDVLLAHLREQVEAEALGTAVALAMLVSDGDPRMPAVKAELNKMSVEAKRVLIASLSVAIDIAEMGKLNNWILEACFEMLLQEDWYNMGHDFIYTITNWIEEDVERVSGLNAFVGLKNGSEKDVMGAIFGQIELMGVRKTESFGGIVHREEYEIKSNLLDEDTFCIILRLLEGAQGIVKSALLGLKFAYTKSAEDWSKLVSSVGGDTRRIFNLPAAVRVYFSREHCRGGADNLEIVKYLNEVPLVERRSGLMVQQGLTAEPDDWERLLSEDFYFTLSHLMRASLRRIERDQDDVTDTFMQFLQSERGLFSLDRILHVHAWPQQHTLAIGALQRISPALGAKIRVYAVASSRAQVPEFHPYRQIVSFPLSLPDEAGLIPHIIGGLVRSVRFRSELRSELRSEEYHVHTYFERVQQLAREFFPDHEMLRQVHVDRENPIRTRAGALIAYYITDLGDRKPTAAELIELFDPSESAWYLPAAALIFSRSVSEGVFDKAEPYGDLLDHARDCIAARVSVEDTARQWREYSAAPATNAINSGGWM